MCGAEEDQGVSFRNGTVLPRVAEQLVMASRNGGYAMMAAMTSSITENYSCYDAGRGDGPRGQTHAIDATPVASLRQ